tara:strand:- start:2946 stop:3854 length:909 start_codon:yes stop_codon:yes gene_type:complete
MDLYGVGQSISMRGSADSAAANANATNKDFNRSIASERDEIKSAAESQLADYEALSSGKVGIQTARLGSLGVSTLDDIKKAYPAAKATTAAEPFADVAVGSSTRAAMRSGARAVGGSGAAPASSGFLGGTSEATEVENIPSGEIGGAAEVAEDTATAGKAAEELGTIGKIAGKLAIGVGGRTAITGLGLGTELYKGINRYESGGKFFGTNTGQQVGMGLSDVGGALQLAGLGMAAFGPVGWAAAGVTELAGTALSIGGAISETIGDTEDQDVQKDKADADADSQVRGSVSSESITTAASRGN